MIKLPIENLKIEDTDKYKVWRYINDDEAGETIVTPVMRLPVKDLDGKLVFTKVKFSGGTLIDAMIGNISVKNPKLTKHTLTLSIWYDDKWFHLARYFDDDLDKYGSTALAQLMEINISEIFPIRYDISAVVSSFSDSLIGTVTAEPEARLTKDEIMDLVISEL